MFLGFIQIVVDFPSPVEYKDVYVLTQIFTSWVKHVHSKHSEEHSELHSKDDDAMEINEFNEIESNTTEIQLQNHKDKEKARWILNLRDENKLTQTCTSFMFAVSG